MGQTEHREQVEWPRRSSIGEPQLPTVTPPYASPGTRSRQGHWRRRNRSRIDEALAVARQLLDEHGRYREDGDITITFSDRRGVEVSGPAAPTGRLVTDLGPSGGRGPGPRTAAEPDYGLGASWGATWRWTTQGWVDRETEHPTWRPVVTTTDALADWEPDTYLGIVTGEAAVSGSGDMETLSESMGTARTIATNGMVDAGVARGAHAVIGVRLDYTQLEGTLLVTATGTAVTLRDR